MTSTLTPEALISEYIHMQFDEFSHDCQTADWDCQDSECNNETKCRFFYPSSLKEERIREYGRELCEMLGVAEDAFFCEKDELDDTWRVQVICTLSVPRSGNAVPLVPKG